VPLSQLGELDPRAFRLFLGLLSDAVAALGPHGQEASVATSDGGFNVRVRRGAPGSAARVTTADGSLDGPDHVLDIELAGEAP
jgi:hypothetical protein